MRGNRVRPTESLTCVNKASCVYEPKLIRLFLELIHKFSVLTMNMKEEETDEVRI